MSTTPRIFIAASAAGLPIAEQLQRELEPRVICMQWRHGLLNLSPVVVEKLTFVHGLIRRGVAS